MLCMCAVITQIPEWMKDFPRECNFSSWVVWNVKAKAKYVGSYWNNHSSQGLGSH